jgi:CRISPR-associated DxTHG motif protein
MNRKVFVSFLGTGKYESCIYQIGQATYTTRFIQEALATHLCTKWGPNDVMLMGLTKEAKAIHWEPETGLGLSDIFSDLLSQAQLTTFEVPAVNSEADIWNLFQITFDQFKEGDEVYLDITHSWRFQPMLLMVLLQFLKTLKSIEVKGIYYGQYEFGKTGPFEVIDLTNFSLMQDWAQAAHIFVKHGLADGAMAMEDMEVTAEDFKKTDKSPLDQFKMSLNFWSANTKTIRGQEMKKSNTVGFLRLNAKKLKGSDVIPPIQLLADFIVEDLEHFPKNNGIEQLEQLLRWYQKKGRIVEGYTLLSELCVEKVLEKLEVALTRMIADFYTANPEKKQYKGTRHLLYETIKLTLSKVNHETRNEGPFIFKENERGLTTSLVEYIISNSPNIKEVADLNWKISKNRNDLNHAGLIDEPGSANKITFYFDSSVQAYFDIFSDAV